MEFSEQIRALKKYKMASQIFKSGTSIGANIREAQNAESKLDFIHKFKAATKESDELQYWLALFKTTDHYPSPNKKITTDLENIIKIIFKSIIFKSTNFQIFKLIWL